MDLKPREFGNLTRDSLEEQTVLRYMDKAPLLHLASIPPDGDFEGIVFCIKSYINKDLYDDSKWSGTFHMIDGDGVKFLAAFYGMETKYEQHQGPAYIKGIKRFKGNNAGREVIEYRLSSITQSTIDCPKSLFLKHLENYDSIIKTLDENMKALFTTPEYSLLIDEAVKLSLLTNIQQETLADTYGTKIGARAEAFNKGCTIMYTMDLTSNINLELCYLALLLKLWKPDVEIEGVLVDSSTNFNLKVNEIVYNSKLSKLDKIKLIDCIAERNKSLEGQLVNSVLSLINNMSYWESKIKFSSTESLGLFI